MKKFDYKKWVTENKHGVKEGPSPCPPVSCRDGFAQHPTHCKCVRASSLMWEKEIKPQDTSPGPFGGDTPKDHGLGKVIDASDLCASMTCPKGTTCINGVCEDDMAARTSHPLDQSYTCINTPPYEDYTCHRNCTGAPCVDGETILREKKGKNKLLNLIKKEVKRLKEAQKWQRPDWFPNDPEYRMDGDINEAPGDRCGPGNGICSYCIEGSACRCGYGGRLGIDHLAYGTWGCSSGCQGCKIAPGGEPTITKQSKEMPTPSDSGPFDPTPDLEKEYGEG